MIRRPPRSTLSSSSAASDVYKRQCLLYKALLRCKANVDYDIPHRIQDGYGINEAMIKKAKDEGIDTLITCDNGISAIDTINYAKRLDMTVIITDHHEVPLSEDTEGK